MEVRILTFEEFKTKYEELLKDRGINTTDEELAKMYSAIYVVSEFLVKDIVKNFNEVWQHVGR